MRIHKKLTPAAKLTATLEYIALSLARSGNHPNVESICKSYGVTRSHLHVWRRTLFQRAERIFQHGSSIASEVDTAKRARRLEDELHRLQTLNDANTD